MAYCNWKAVQKAIEAAPTLPPPSSMVGVSAQKTTGAHQALVVLIIIAGHINIDNGETFLAYGTIADEALVSVSSAKRVVKHLVASGHLIKESGGSSLRDCNTYRFGPAMDVVSPPSPSAPAPPPAKAPAPPPPVIPPASEAATQLSTQFGEMLGQAGKHTVKQKNWPAMFDALLTSHTQAELTAMIEWLSSVDTFWPPKIRSKEDPLLYLTEKVHTILDAKAYPDATTGDRNQRVSRNAPAPRSTISSLLEASAF